MEDDINAVPAADLQAAVLRAEKNYASARYNAGARPPGYVEKYNKDLIAAREQLAAGEKKEAEKTATIAGNNKNTPEKENNNKPVNDNKPVNAANAAGDDTSNQVDVPNSQKPGSKFSDPRNAMLRDVFFIGENNHLKIKTSSHFISNGMSQTNAANEKICGPIYFDPELEAIECAGSGGSVGGAFSWTSSCVDFMGKMLFKKVGVMDSDPALARICADGEKKVKYRDANNGLHEATGEVRSVTNGIIVKTTTGAEVYIPTNKIQSQEDMPARVKSVDITRKFPMHGFWYPSSPALQYNFSPTIIPPIYPVIRTPPPPPGGDGSGDNTRKLVEYPKISSETQKELAIDFSKLRGSDKYGDGVPLVPRTVPGDPGKPGGGGGSGAGKGEKQLVDDPTTPNPDQSKDPLIPNPDPKGKNDKPILAGGKCTASNKTVSATNPVGGNGSGSANGSIPRGKVVLDPPGSGGNCIAAGPVVTGTGAAGVPRVGSGSSHVKSPLDILQARAKTILQENEITENLRRQLAAKEKELQDIIASGGSIATFNEIKAEIERLKRLLSTPLPAKVGTDNPTSAPNTESGASGSQEVQNPNPGGSAAPNLENEEVPGQSITNLENEIKKKKERELVLVAYNEALAKLEADGSSVFVYEDGVPKSGEDVAAELADLREKIKQLEQGLSALRGDPRRSSNVLKQNTALGTQIDSVRYNSGTSSTFTGMVSELRSLARNRTANVSSIDIAKIAFGEHNIYSQIMAIQIQKNQDVSEANNTAATEVIESFDVQGGWGCTTSLSAFTTAEAEEGTGVFRGVTA